MGAYGPAFLQKAISVFDEGRVSVNAKILKKIIPSMDPAEAYTGLAWAGWCIAQNTLPENQTQVLQPHPPAPRLLRTLLALERHGGPPASSFVSLVCGDLVRMCM